MASTRRLVALLFLLIALVVAVAAPAPAAAKIAGLRRRCRFRCNIFTVFGRHCSVSHLRKPVSCKTKKTLLFFNRRCYSVYGLAGECVYKTLRYRRCSRLC